KASVMQRAAAISFVTLCFGSAWQAGFAQDFGGIHPANWKIAMYSANSSQQHAQNSSHMLYYYTQSHLLAPTQPAPADPAAEASKDLTAAEQEAARLTNAKLRKQEITELVAAIRREVTIADKQLAKVKVAHAKQADVVKQIDSIAKRHAKVQELCGTAE